MYEAPVIFEDVMGYRIHSVFNHVSEFEEHSPKNVTMNGELLSNYKFIQRTEWKERHHRKTPFTLFPSQKDFKKVRYINTSVLCSTVHKDDCHAEVDRTEKKILSVQVRES